MDPARGLYMEGGEPRNMPDCSKACCDPAAAAAARCCIEVRAADVASAEDSCTAV